MFLGGPGWVFKALEQILCRPDMLLQDIPGALKHHPQNPDRDIKAIAKAPCPTHQKSI